MRLSAADFVYISVSGSASWVFAPDPPPPGFCPYTLLGTKSGVPRLSIPNSGYAILPTNKLA